MKERILFPAIKTGENQFSVTPSIDEGHSSIINHLIGNGAHGMVDMDGLGFVTTFGKFVNRDDAMKIAISSGQLKSDAPKNGPLYSFHLEVPN
jgi:hypothetical protein